MTESERLAITVVIPTIPPRTALAAGGAQQQGFRDGRPMLERAVASVQRQKHPAHEIIVELDEHRTGAAATRQRGLDRVETPLVAFLDDDDELLPHHLGTLYKAIERPDPASGRRPDVVYPWFTVEGGTDPFPGRFGAVFDEKLLRRSQYVPITVLARTQAVRDAGGFRENPNTSVSGSAGATNEDHTLWVNMLDEGFTFAHVAMRTWLWHHHGANTSGNRERW